MGAVEVDFAALLEAGLEEEAHGPAQESPPTEKLLVGVKRERQQQEEQQGQKQQPQPSTAVTGSQAKSLSCIQPRKRRRCSAAASPPRAVTVKNEWKADVVTTAASAPALVAPVGGPRIKQEKVVASQGSGGSVTSLPLPPEMVMYVLRFLSPADLSSASQVSSLRGLAWL